MKHFLNSRIYLAGIKDFLPEQRSDSYENFSHVTEKGCRWAAGQSDVTITNMQAVFVKRKGEILFLDCM